MADCYILYTVFDIKNKLYMNIWGSWMNLLQLLLYIFKSLLQRTMQSLLSIPKILILGNNRPEFLIKCDIMLHWGFIKTAYQSYCLCEPHWGQIWINSWMINGPSKLSIIVSIVIWYHLIFGHLLIFLIKLWVINFFIIPI